jgi:hypothetical protein
MCRPPRLSGLPVRLHVGGTLSLVGGAMIIIMQVCHKEPHQQTHLLC